MSGPSRKRRDPFQVLAVLTILLGMMIVAGGAAFWMLTGRESSLIIATGVALTLGGPVGDRISSSVRKLSEVLYYSQQPYDTPPDETEELQPWDRDQPQPPRRPRGGGERHKR